jgi:hypothetical protein
MSTERSLELEEQYEAQKRAWFVQRIGWCVLAMVLLAAVLGGFGPGALGKVSVLDRTGLRLDYDRFVRYEAPASLRLELPASAHDEQAFFLDASWLHGVHLQTIQPEPIRTQSEGKRVRYTMRVQRRGAPTQVSLHYEADAPGSLAGSVALEDGTPLRISQFVYP